MDNHRSEPADEILLRQVDDLLERGKRSDDVVMNMLADTIPQADSAFQRRLEKRLVAQLRQNIQNNQESNAMGTMTARAPRIPTISVWVWAAAVIALVIVGGSVMRLPGGSSGMQASQAPIEPPQSIVVATQYIGAGETITADMVALVSLSNDDFTVLQLNQPDRQFFHDPAEVVGQVTSTAIFWFEPVEPIKLGDSSGVCVPGSRYCFPMPAGYYAGDFPRSPFIPPEELGLSAGDWVDVLAVADGKLTTIVRGVLLGAIAPDRVTIAATSWKNSVLGWLWGTDETYLLRLGSQPTPAPTADDARVEYHFSVPEPLPDDYHFDLIARFPLAESYRLSDAPNLDAVQFTQQDKTMNFWFTGLDLVSITDGTNVVIRLPEADAAALDYLLKQGARLSFIPQSQ